VTSVGGTQLHLDEDGARTAQDNVWNERDVAGGGGLSKVFTRPEYQDGVAGVVGGRRGVPDLSLSAACDGAVVRYDSFPTTYRGAGPSGWHLDCGTSEAAPLFAGIVAIADQAAGRRLGFLNDRLYRLFDESHHRGLVDVTRGDNTVSVTDSRGAVVTIPGFAAVSGYDLASGLGTIDAARLVEDLAES
jgi:subtilase family serine protease